MDTDRFQRIKDLVLEALEQDTGARGVFLDDACGSDAALRAEVEELLTDHDGHQTDQFLSPLKPYGGGSDTDGDDGKSRIGQRVGVYELREHVGAGGMGDVYRAVRTDDYEQTVAVKLVRRGADSDEILRRFSNEMQLLASIGDHPNIARLLDAGTTDDGGPYFVMEFVPGKPIDRHCDGRKLSIRARLELFRSVCAAVAFAHRHAVIHRDLKPSNILVTEDNIPKLIDFGIAKLTAPGEGRPQVTETRTQARVFTPHYACPEQMRGEPVSTASDVYSLGIVLYELLTGHRPYRLSETTPLRWAEIVCGREPRKPSTAIFDAEPINQDESDPTTDPVESVATARGESPRRLARILAGDLDNIVLMALRKEPDRRYASVERFSDDISRYLRELPVRARRDSLGYRTTKFIRRNRVAVTLGTLVLLSLIGGIVGTTLQSIRAQENAARAQAEADRANREADAAQTAAGMLAQMFEANAPHQLAGFRVGSIDGTSSQPRLPSEDVLASGADQVRTGLASRPVMQATLLDAIGNAYVGLGLPKKGEPLLTEALEIRRRVLPADHEDLTASLQSMAWLRFIQGRFADAEPFVREVLAARRSQLGEQHPETIMTKFWLAVIFTFIEAHHDRVDALLDEVIQWRRDNQGPRHPDVGYALICQAIIRANRGRSQDALSLVLEAGQIFSADENTHELGQAISTVARSAVEAQLGNTEQAISLAEQAFEMGRNFLGKDHAFVEIFALYPPRALQLAGKLEEAAQLHEAAINRLREEGRGSGYFCARHLADLGMIRASQGQREEGIQLTQDALVIFREVLGETSQRIVVYQIELAQMYSGQGNYDAAVQLLRETLKICQALEVDGFGNTGWCRGELKRTLELQEESDKAGSSSG